jgi:hypothetical protein
MLAEMDTCPGFSHHHFFEWAPHCRGDRERPRADLFALGALLVDEGSTDRAIIAQEFTARFRENSLLEHKEHANRG